ncbi:hypothetical protein T484DRAFT_3629692 [Baffinella frigidus]|nr:hypothetical protein T484DRAFT_3629692 [Cryptophyta sp. CCMP2293]
MSHSSIGNMTNTLIETGARHMQQCRTNYDVLVALADGEDNLLGNDDKWNMAPDELAVSCGKHLIADAAITATKYAYPSVITTLGSMNNKEKSWIASYYHFMSSLDKEDWANQTKDLLDSEDTPDNKINQYRHFVPVGYSVGKACAHAHKGDTIASVQIGGLRTVLNGAYEVQTGDLLQMYIPDAESCMFNEAGGRKEMADVRDVVNHVGGTSDTKLDSEGVQRRNFYTRGLGMKASGSVGRVKEGMFSLKPFMESQNDGGVQYYGDRMRVFAKALSSSRPFEPVDIMVARQSL